MSFIGNFFAADAAKKIGAYNNALYQQQANYKAAQTKVNKTAYDNINRPMLLKSQDQNYDNIFVNLLKSGAEVRSGETGYLVLLEQKINDATTIAIEDYNSTTAYYDGMNESLLLKAKGAGELYKGQLEARSQIAQGIGKAASAQYKYGSILAG